MIKVERLFSYEFSLDAPFLLLACTKSHLENWGHLFTLLLTPLLSWPQITTRAVFLRVFGAHAPHEFFSKVAHQPANGPMHLSQGEGGGLHAAAIALHKTFKAANA